MSVKKFKSLITLLIVVIVVSLCLSMVISWKINNKKIDMISDTVSTENNIAFVSREKNNISVVLMDNKGYEVNSLDYPEKTLSDGHILNNFCTELLTYNNRVYMHIVSCDTSNGTVINERIVLCDFKNNSLKNKWDIPTEGDKFKQSAYGCEIINDNLYYISEDENNIMHLNLIDGVNMHSIKQTFSSDNRNIMQWAITDELRIIGYSSYQGIFEFSGNSSERLYPLNDEENISLVNFEYDGEGSIYITDLNEEKNIIYNLEADSFKDNDIVYNFNCTLLNSDSNLENNIEFSDLKNISYRADGSFTAICNSESDYNRIAVCSDENIVLFDSINFRTFKIFKIFKYFLICFAVLGIFSLLLYYYYKKNMYISITMKITALSIVITLFGSAMISDNIKNLLYENLRDDMYDTLLSDGMNVSRNVSSTIYNYGYDYDTVNEQLNLYDFSDLYNRNIRENNIIASPNCILHMIDENGNLITMNNSDGIENIPSEYIYSKYDIDIYNKVISECSPAIITRNTFSGECYVLVYPLINSAETEILECDAVIEISIEEYIVNSRVSEYTNKIGIIVLMSMIMLIIIFVIILGFALRPIKILTEKIKKRNVKIAQVKNITFKEEVKDIRTVLENMLANIIEYQKNIQNNNETYSKFLPSEIFSMLGNNNISELETGTSKKIFLNNVFIDLQQIDNEILEKNYDNIITYISKNDCIIENFNLDYMEISFKNNPEKIICDIKNLINQFNDMYIGISYGVSILAIVGGSERLQAMIISGQKKLAGILSGIGKKFSRNMIVSEDFLKQNNGLNQNFSIRFIGHIFIDDHYIKIYDVLDMSPDMDKNLQTKKDFECGIEYFLQKKFVNAKICFIDVLKYNKNDVIAKEYLNMCDIYISDTLEADTDILSGKGVDDIETIE